MVNIDTVYQKVLMIANKEQRGYITPQEFNLFADHAQMEIFEQYFYDLEQIKRRGDFDNDGQHQSIQANLEDKIDIFLRSFVSVSISNATGTVLLDPWIYKLSMVRVTYQNQPSNWAGMESGHTTSLVERISHDDHLMHSRAPLTTPTPSRPTYKMKRSGNDSTIQIQPFPDLNTDNVYLDYIVKPKMPNWTYVISGESALYNPNGIGHQDFELHRSEENNLVIKILTLAGVAIKDLQLAQVAAGKEASIITQQKQ